MKRAAFVTIILIMTFTVMEGKAQDFSDFGKEMNELEGLWKKILDDQKRLNLTLDKVRDSDRLFRVKEEIIFLLNDIYRNVRTKRSVMENLPVKNSIRNLMKRRFRAEENLFRKNRKIMSGEFRRISGIGGCAPIVREIKKVHGRYREGRGRL